MVLATASRSLVNGAISWLRRLKTQMQTRSPWRSSCKPWRAAATTDCTTGRMLYEKSKRRIKSRGSCSLAKCTTLWGRCSSNTRKSSLVKPDRVRPSSVTSASTWTRATLARNMGAVCAAIETAQRNDVVSFPQVLGQVFQDFILSLAFPGPSVSVAEPTLHSQIPTAFCHRAVRAVSWMKLGAVMHDAALVGLGNGKWRYRP